jgi:hypothetical protein
MTRIDLHAHTTHSDGSLAPGELVERAAAVGLSALAVTDHDTTTALTEARAAGTRLGVEIVDGCEVTARGDAGIVHVLVYEFSHDDEGFSRLLERVRAGRDERNAAILEKLAGLGVPLEPGDVRRHAVGRIVARPHLARAMVERGYVDDVRQAFDYYLRDGGPAYVRADVPSGEAVIEAAAGAGGLCVLAHPRSLRLSSRAAFADVFRRFRDAGLVGVEVDHPSHDVNRRTMFGELADSLDLVRSGGSDFHGAMKPHIELGSGDGTIEVGYETLERLRAKRPA